VTSYKHALTLGAVYYKVHKFFVVTLRIRCEASEENYLFLSNYDRALQNTTA